MLIDDAGAVQNYYTYDPFGTLFDNQSSTTTVENPFRFAGYWWDDEIAQYYCRARQYDPQLQRFTSIDPVIGRLQEPLTLHQYLYCLNDPVNRWDPDGQYSLIGMMLTGAKNAYMGWRAYDAVTTAQSYARRFADAFGNRNRTWGLILEIGSNLAADAAMSFFAGQGVKYMSKAGGAVAGAVSKSIRRHKDKIEKIDVWSHGNPDINPPVDIGTAWKGAKKWLGDFDEIEKGVYRSKDGLRGFRMGNTDVMGDHAGFPHVNFESFNEFGQKLEDFHQAIIY
ncbi:RHS repeat-associated core domain-containing protein [Planctomycetota bacterium]